MYASNRCPRLISTSHTQTRVLPQQPPSVNVRLVNKPDFPRPVYSPVTRELPRLDRVFTPKNASEVKVPKIPHFPAQREQALRHYSSQADNQRLQVNPTSATSAEMPKDKVVQYGENLLVELETSQKGIHIPFKGSQRKEFIEWFAKNALHHKNSELTAAGFREEDWKYLGEQLKKNKVSEPEVVVMTWMTNIAERLKSGMFIQKNSWDHDSGIWLFFHYSAKFLSKQSSKHQSFYSQAKCFTQAMTAEDFCRYFEAFKGTFFADLILNNILDEEPKKLVQWIGLLEKQPERDIRTSVSEKIQELFQFISSVGRTHEAIYAIFTNSNPSLSLTTYCSLDTEHRRKILRHLKANEPDWIQTLLAWTRLILNEPQSLKPFVKDEFAKDFYNLINEIDPSVADNLREMLKPHISAPWHHFYFAGLLPDVQYWKEQGLNPDHPNFRQSCAHERLWAHFSTEGISLQDRRNFIRALQKDLVGGEKASVHWVKAMFNRLPSSTWPLIFLLFEHDICTSSYFDYYEEKSKGGLFNSVDKNKPRGLAWEPDVHEWINIASITLRHMLDNPVLRSGDDLESQAACALQHWYQAVCETNTIQAVIENFIENDKKFIFIPLMDKLAHSAFNYNRAGFTKLVSDCLNNAKTDKLSYIAKCLLTQSKRKIYDISPVRIVGPIQLEYEIWGDAFLINHKERGTVARKLFESAGIPFVGYFTTAYPYSVAASIIESCKIADPKHCEELFFDWSMMLSEATDSARVKLKVFQRVCDVFSKAGFDVIEMLEKEQLKDIHEEIKSWYESIDCEEEAYFSPVGLLLLKRYNAENYPSFILKHIESVFKDHYPHHSFVYLFKALEKTGDANQILDLLEGQPKILSLIKTVLEKNMRDYVYYLSSDSFHTFPLVSKLIPDWKERLTTWVIEEIRKNKEFAEDFGNKPNYEKIRKLYEALQRCGLANQWMDSWQKTLSPETKAEIFFAIAPKSKL